MVQPHGHCGNMLTLRKLMASLIGALSKQNFYTSHNNYVNVPYHILRSVIFSVACSFSCCF